MMKRYAILLLALSIPVAACDRGEPGEMERPSEAMAVVVSASADIEEKAQVPARIVASETAELATRVSGTVQAVTVDVGEIVRAGQLLVRLEGAGVESALERAEAQAMVSRRTFERISNLERDGAATRQELDEAEAGVRGAEAALAEARAARDYVIMRAPFDGTVTARHADPGDLAVPGRPVLRIAATHAVKIQADLPATLAATIAAGDHVGVVRSDTGDRWPATVTRVVPVIELASQKFRVEAEFDEPADAPAAGTFARLELGTGGTASPWVPEDALVRQGQLTGVFVVVGDELRLRWIRPGRQASGAVEVLAGLPAGALVVRRPGPMAVDGLKVAGVSEEAWSFTPEDGE